MRLVTSTIAVLVLLHSCQAEVFLNIEHPGILLSRILNAHCERSPGVTDNDVKEIRFWGLNNKPNVNFLATRNCNDNNSAFTVVDTSDKRISLRSDFWLKWRNVTLADVDSYKCSLFLCGASQPEESLNSVKITVVTPPSKPEINVTPNVKVVMEKLEQTLQVTCKGNAGYPGGAPYLRYKTKTWLLQYDYFFEVDSTGNFEGTEVFTLNLNRYDYVTLTCVSYNNGTTLPTIYYVSHSIEVEFPPTLTMTATKYLSNPDSTNHYVMKEKAPFESTVSCKADSQPKSNVALSLVSGPPGFRLYDHLGTSAVVKVSEEQLGGLREVEILLKCESLYKSSLPEIPVINSTSTMSIFVYAGASLVKVSIGAFLATVLLLVKAFQ